MTARIGLTVPFRHAREGVDTRIGRKLDFELLRVDVAEIPVLVFAYGIKGCGTAQFVGPDCKVVFMGSGPGGEDNGCLLYTSPSPRD